MGRADRSPPLREDAKKPNPVRVRFFFEDERCPIVD